MTKKTVTYMQTAPTKVAGVDRTLIALNGPHMIHTLVPFKTVCGEMERKTGWGYYLKRKEAVCPDCLSLVDWDSEVTSVKQVRKP